MHRLPLSKQQYSCRRAANIAPILRLPFCTDASFYSNQQARKARNYYLGDTSNTLHSTTMLFRFFFLFGRHRPSPPTHNYCERPYPKCAKTQGWHSLYHFPLKMHILALRFPKLCLKDVRYLFFRFPPYSYAENRALYSILVNQTLQYLRAVHYFLLSSILSLHHHLQ